MSEPKASAQLEIIMYGAKNEFGMDRISIRLEGEALLQMAAQLENIGNLPGNRYYYETETTKIWLHGSIDWESEEQRQEYLSKNKYTKLI